MDDTKLVEQLLDRDNRAWTTFVKRFEPVIRRRISQVFYRYSYRGSTGDYQDAFDFVLDHLMFDRTLSGFKKSQSLDGFVIRVTTNAVIDWHRKRCAERNMYGLRPSEVAQLAGSECAVEVDDNANGHNNDRESDELFASIPWTIDERLMLRVMSVRTASVRLTDIQEIAGVTGEPVSIVDQKIENLRVKLHSRWSENKELYDELGLLWMRSLVLERRGDHDRAEKRKTYLDKRLAEYQAKGVEPYPTRKELAEIFHWDINKVDRIKRRIEAKLRDYIDQVPGKTLKLTRPA